MRRSARASRLPCRRAERPPAIPFQNRAERARASRTPRESRVARSPPGRRAPSARPRRPGIPSDRRRSRGARPRTNPPAALRGLEFFAKQRVVERLGVAMLGPRLVEPTAESVERLCPTRLGRLQPGIEHQLGEVSLFLQLAQDGAG